MSHPMLPSSTVRTWRPRLGACVDAGGVTFSVWAPARRQVQLVLLRDGGVAERRVLTRAEDGMFHAAFVDVSPGDLYSYLLDADGPFPDPASRFQPQGVHGPSAVVDPKAFSWSDEGWRGVRLEDAVIYELHVGTFAESGTFAGAAEQLPYLADLGVTVIELMPIADFPGCRNWGYDGASLFAPSRAYGTPDDLRRLVDAAHRAGLAVVLDVVYNHFAPDGAYAAAFSPFYASTRHRSPWGAAVNLDGEGSAQVREFFIENAQHWLHEYHLDGLRLDATHALVDDSPRHFVAELAARVRASLPDRQPLLMAEDDRNDATIVRRGADGGWGLDAVWADDFHHQLRRFAAGDRDGYYADYTGSLTDVATTIQGGWFYRGQVSAYRGQPRGTDPSGVPLARMIVCLQNHDQIGNRPFGRRLNHQIEPSLFRALSALLLFVPETPLLFMGQEWAAGTRFQFFTDHYPELGALVTVGRREEFARFEAFADPAARDRIPDPQAYSTFDNSRLIWSERTRPPHAGVLELYRTLLRLRRTEPVFQHSDSFDAFVLDDAVLALLRRRGHDSWLLVFTSESDRRVDLQRWRAAASNTPWQVLLSTDESRFGGSGRTAALDSAGGLVTFTQPAAVILTSA
jgi:maltooligosyltrehalose trehalohydrolase